MTSPKETGKSVQGSGQLSTAAVAMPTPASALVHLYFWGVVLFLDICCHFGTSDLNSLNRACLTVAVPSNLGGKGCPQFDSLLSSGVWIRIKLKLLPKTVCCCTQYVCMNPVAINFEHLVLYIVILTATLQQEGNAFLSLLKIRYWHMKAE